MGKLHERVGQDCILRPIFNRPACDVAKATRGRWTIRGRIRSCPTSTSGSAAPSRRSSLLFIVNLRAVDSVPLSILPLFGYPHSFAIFRYHLVLLRAIAALPVSDIA